MRIHQIILISLLFLSLSNWSDLLGNKELQAELEKHKTEEGFSVSLAPSNRDYPPPLWVIDDEIWKYERILNHELTPKDIKSIKVLKDKEAIKKYGSDGENGVVLITTKKKIKN